MRINKRSDIKSRNIAVFLSIFTVLFLSFSFGRALAVPSSTNFQLLDYGFGSGGVATSSSTNFMFQGITGEIETASLSSANFMVNPGLTFTLQPNLPPAPTMTNTSDYYNKISLIVNNANNSTDTTFAIKIASGSSAFTTNVYYVQADNTLGGLPVWQTYTAWGGASGITLIGLSQGTTYYGKVAAKRGSFTQGPYGPTGSASTINPTLTFSLITSSQSVPPFTVDVGQLNAGTVTTSTDKVTATVTTNATNGALVYVYGVNTGLKSSTAANYTIGSVSNNLASISEGYGARGTSVTQSSGGPMELVSPYDGAANNVGILDTTERLFADSTSAPVTSGEASFEIKAKASNTTPSAGDYTDTLTVIGTGSF